MKGRNHNTITLLGRRRNRFLTGFTLLEILVGMMILTIGLASVFGLFGVGTRSYRRGLNDVNVSAMAMTILSDIENMENIPVDPLENQTHPNFPAIYKYDLTFLELPGYPDRTILATLRIKINEGKGGAEEFQVVLKPRAKIA